MKRQLAAGLIAMPLLAFSSVAFSMAPEEVHDAPLLLSVHEMDGITAAKKEKHEAKHSYKSATITQVNISPVTIIQIGYNNTAIVYSGNFLTLTQ